MRILSGAQGVCNNTVQTQLALTLPQCLSNMKARKGGLCSEGVSDVGVRVDRILLNIRTKPAPIHNGCKSWSHCLGDPPLAGGPAHPARDWFLEKVCSEGASDSLLPLKAQLYHIYKDSITQYLRILASNKKYLGWRLLTHLDHLKRFCLLCIFNKGSDKIGSPSFLPCILIWVINFGPAFSLIEAHIHDQKTCSSLLRMPNTFRLQPIP